MITPNEQIIHDITPNSVATKMSWSLVIIVVLGTLFFGIISGYAIKTISTGTFFAKNNSASTDSTASVKETSGILDKETFKDKAEGILKEGGFEGEGSFHLERPGGVSQNVYLTSTTIDLNEYLGKKVRVWGATFAAEKAGWLMDVGYLEVLK